jgi:hypothetical protein
VDVVAGPVDREARRIKVVGDPGQIRVELALQVGPDEVSPLFGRKDEVHEKPNQGFVPWDRWDPFRVRSTPFRICPWALPTAKLPAPFQDAKPEAARALIGATPK